jgi:hypothetical protein
MAKRSRVQSSIYYHEVASPTLLGEIAAMTNQFAQALQALMH